MRYPPIAELSEPMLRLAGIRINPKTNGLHNTVFQSNLLLRKIPEGTEIKIALPPNPKLSTARWSPDGSHFAFTNSTAAGIESGSATPPRATPTDCPTYTSTRCLAAEDEEAGEDAADRRPADRCSGCPMAGRCWYTPCAPIAALLPRNLTVPKGRTSGKPRRRAKARPLTRTCCRIPHDEDLFEYYATVATGDCG